MHRFINATATLLALAGDPQRNRLLRMEFPHGDGPGGAMMLANKLVAREAMSLDFRFEVEVLSDDARIPLKQVIDKMVTVSLVREDGTLRYFNGYITEFRLVKGDGGYAHYTMILEPWLAYCKRTRNSAVFLGKTVIELTEAIFEQYPQRDWRNCVYGEYRKHTCANQFNETDHNHLHRRWEDEGLHYWYEHRADGHTLCIGDMSTLAAPIDAGVDANNPQVMPFRSGAGSKEDDGIQEWQAVRRRGSGSFVVGSFNFKHAQAQTASYDSPRWQGDMKRDEVFESAGAYAYNTGADGEMLAKLRMEELDSRDQYFEAKGNDTCAQPGRSFKLGGHFSAAPRPAPRGEAPNASIGQRDYLILSVVHTATNNYHAGTSVMSAYSNEFTCIRQTIPWRPGRGFNSYTPTIPGPQTAIVVGPPEVEIHTDEYGRVRVQFHWDRFGKFDNGSSPWVRVMTSWAGDRFGCITIPRVGQEVILLFLDGNVDRPIIMGGVFNKNNMPPWGLPDNKTQSGILTRSTKNGDGANANALRFDDMKGKEQLWLHAERDQLTEVEHDEDKWVGNDRRKTVDHDEISMIKNDRTETVGHDEKITVNNNRSERVAQDENIDIGGNRSEHVGGHEHVFIDGTSTEIVKLAKTETIGLAKALSVGGAYAITVGAAMNTLVTLSQFAEVMVNKVLKVGKKFHVSAGDEYEIVVGKAMLKMEKDGSITLTGTRIVIGASGPVQINGKDVDLN